MTVQIYTCPKCGRPFELFYNAGQPCFGCVHCFRNTQLTYSDHAEPLGPLCEWLSENSMNIPCKSCPNFSNDYCTAIGDASKPCPQTADYWRQAITKWMEEQDAAD